LSDPLDDVYEKYLRQHSDADIETKIMCPRCGSDNVDRREGYRGEYKCLQCDYNWQVGGFQAT
jgi:ribosomal protein L37AE/L43A